MLHLDVHKETVVACLRLVADGKLTNRSSYVPDDHSAYPARSSPGQYPQRSQEANAARSAVSNQHERSR